MIKQPKARIFTSFKNPSLKNVLPAYYSPNELGVEGEDHINISVSSKSRLGRLLDPACTYEIDVPNLGKFSSALALIYWLKSEGKVDIYRYITLGDLKDVPRKIKVKELLNYDAILLYATMCKLKRALHIKEEVLKTDPAKLASYILNRTSGVRCVTPNAQNIVPVMQELISSIREEREPNYAMFLRKGTTLEDSLMPEYVRDIVAAKKADVPKKAKKNKALAKASELTGVPVEILDVASKIEGAAPKAKQEGVLDINGNPDPEAVDKVLKKRKRKKVTPEEQRAKDEHLMKHFNEKVKRVGSFELKHGVTVQTHFTNLWEVNKILLENTDPCFIKAVTVVVDQTSQYMGDLDDKIPGALKSLVETFFLFQECNSIRRLAKKYPTLNPVLYESDVAVTAEGNVVKVDVNGKTHDIEVALEPSAEQQESVLDDFVKQNIVERAENKAAEEVLSPTAEETTTEEPRVLNVGFDVLAVPACRDIAAENILEDIGEAKATDVDSSKE